jgi:predicted metalloprotease with PDZ domain
MNKTFGGVGRGLAACALAFLFGAARPAAATIHYEISLAHPDQHRFTVTMAIPNSGPQTTVALPAWNALYQVRDFAYRVRDVQVTAENKTPVAVRKLDKQTWQIGLLGAGAGGNAPDTMIVRYTIEWNEPGPFDSQLNDHHAFINFAEVLMYVPARRAEDVDVTIASLPEGWKTIAELPAAQTPDSYSAASYDKLVDAPLEAGRFEEVEFESGGAHFRVVVDGKDWNKSHLEGSLRRITEYEIQLMGGAPFREYTFFFHIGSFPEVGGGGMEHANCTAIGGGTVDSVVQTSAHEFFHAWNVKRIRPQSLEPVDYTKEQFSRALWFAEGVTSTYSAYALERTGLWSKEQLYADLGAQIQMLASRPAHLWQSAEESSLDTWFDKYDLYGAADRSISYYNKGQLLGVMLDLAIRDATDNHKSLDDVMRRLNDEYAKQGKFYNESEGIRAVVEEVAGKSFENFFQRYVGGVEEIPYGNFLTAAGLALKTEDVNRGELGFIPGGGPGGEIVVTSVKAGSAAEAAGIETGDTILQINGREAGHARGGLFGNLAPGETVTLHISRASREMDISYVAGTREERRYSIAESPGISERQRRIRQGLLRGTTD